MRKFIVAAVQMDTGNDKNQNLQQMLQYIEEAARRGADLVVFPEVATILSEAEVHAEPIPGPTTRLLAQKAKDCGIWVHGGSMSEINPNGLRTYNTSVLINPAGEIVAKYRKLHNFDMILPDGSSVRESDNKEPGSHIVTVQTELGCLGFAICYDMRFPELFRIMRLQGAEVIFLPANFTLPTGKDHWEPLLRARAIENICYVAASNRVGADEYGTYKGHSVILNPYGQVIASCNDGEQGSATAALDDEMLMKIRYMHKLNRM